MLGLANLADASGSSEEQVREELTQALEFVREKGKEEREKKKAGILLALYFPAVAKAE